MKRSRRWVGATLKFSTMSAVQECRHRWGLEVYNKRGSLAGLLMTKLWDAGDADVRDRLNG